MSDINPVMVSKIIFVDICQMKGINPERAWVDDRISKIKKRYLEKWPIEKLRKYLLASFCDPAFVEEALVKIKNDRLCNSQ